MAEPHAPTPSAADIAAEQPHHEHAAGHGAKGHGGRHGGGHGDGHGGGGHGGGNWIVTYCDMITLLIAFFICILTFASRESGNQNFPKFRDSVLYGPGGSGPAGAAIRGSDRDAVVWRQLLISAYPSAPGSRIPPLYSDPTFEKTSEVLHLLETSSLGTLGDSHVIRMPMVLFFDKEQDLTPTGQYLLRYVAYHVRRLPYNLLVQVAQPQHLAQAVGLVRHLQQKNAMEPSKLGVGIRPATEELNPHVWFVLQFQP